MVRRMTIFQGTEPPGVNPGIVKPFGAVGGPAHTAVGNTIPIAGHASIRFNHNFFITDPTDLSLLKRGKGGG
jgi:hypothetical protein